MAKKISQAQILEVVRGEQDMNITLFAISLGTSRPTYYSWLDGAEIEMKKLCLMAIERVGEWRGNLARELISLVDVRLVPCVCQTEVGDNGACPKHGAPSAVRVEEQAEHLENEKLEVGA